MMTGGRERQRWKSPGMWTAVVLVVGVLMALVLGFAEFPDGGAHADTPAPTKSTGDRAAAITAIVREAMSADHLKAVIFRVTVDGKPIVTQALGESMTGVPATSAMHFRNGAVAISYMSTLLLEYVDEHRLSLSDKVAEWYPDLPDADQVTLKMLANMTSGYPDYVSAPAFGAAYLSDPFQNFTAQQQIDYAFSTTPKDHPLWFEPGTNWGYAHTNYVILGEILQKVGGQPLADLLREKVLEPLGLTNTVASQTAEIPSPVLHAFDSERRVTLGVPAGTPFYEESTFWNPSWTLATGAVETTDIGDMTKTAQGIGSGSLLSKRSYDLQTGPYLLGFGNPQQGCNCAKQTELYNYGLGIVRSGSWLLQNPLFSGFGATEAYLPLQKIAIAVAVTFGPQAFNADGDATNASDPIFRAIGAYLAPKDPPPTVGGATSAAEGAASGL